jgi:hypothetical protein
MTIVNDDSSIVSEQSFKLIDNARGVIYYKNMTIVNDDSSIVRLIDNARGVIYDCRMFIIQAIAPA